MVHEYFSSKLHHMSNPCPEKVQSVGLLKGEWGRAGSVIFWRFADGGKTNLTSKEIMEERDYENKKITYKMIEGSLLEQYMSFCFFFQATPKGEGSYATWTLKYEKPNKSVPDPNSMLQFCFDLTKVVDANLVLRA